MNIGDLVRYKLEHPYKKLGIVVGTDWQKIGSGIPCAQIMWCGEYGTFWTRVRELEVLNESG